MLYGKKLMCLMLLPTLFSPSTLTTPPSTAMQIVEKQVDNKEVLKTDKLGLIENPFITKTKKLKEENEKVNEEQLRKQKDIKEQKKNENRVYYDFVLTYYALLQEECGKTDGITASGKKISRGMIASPKVFKFGTKIVIGDNEYIVEDRGSNKYIKVNNDGSIRLDIYIPRLQGESNSQYSKRVNNMGVKRIQGHVIK